VFSLPQFEAILYLIKRQIARKKYYRTIKKYASKRLFFARKGVATKPALAKAGGTKTRNFLTADLTDYFYHRAAENAVISKIKYQK